MGYYIGPAMKHCRCYTAYIPKIRTERITDTVTLISSSITIPSCGPEEHIKQAINDILHILRDPQKNSTFIMSGKETSNAVKIVAEILKRNIKQQSSTNERLDPSLQVKTRIILPGKKCYECTKHWHLWARTSEGASNIGSKHTLTGTQ